MLRLAAVVAAVVGCYAPAVEDGVPCGDGNACPFGQMCDVDQRCRTRPLDAGMSDPDAAVDATVVDAPPDGDPNVDTDSDGVNDATDNCRMIANTNQRDHDGDSRGDVCDNCPHVANTGQAAGGDADQVGDACDPSTGRVDTQILFEGFYGGTPTGWSLPADWTVSGGKLVGTIASGSTIAYLDVALADNLTVVAGVAMVPGSGTPNVGAVAHLTPAMSNYFRCSVVASTTPRAEIALANGPMFTMLDQISYGNATFMDIAFRLDITGTTVTCAARAGLETANLAGTGTATGKRLGLRVREATGSFDYVVAYSH